jgi:hypothetical protein
MGPLSVGVILSAVPWRCCSVFCSANKPEIELHSNSVEAIKDGQSSNQGISVTVAVLTACYEIILPV